jgi:hypothetical protein
LIFGHACARQHPFRGTAVAGQKVRKAGRRRGQDVALTVISAMQDFRGSHLLGR